MTVTCYSVPWEMTSPKWCQAFAKGCRGQVNNKLELQSGDVALFGSPYLLPLLEQAKAEERTWYYGDHAYFCRRRFYRITRNTMQLEDLSGHHDPRRFEQLGIAIKKWRPGHHILLCPNSEPYMERHGTTVQAWVDSTVRTLRQHTSREIRVRNKHGGGTLEGDMAAAHAVVVYTSMCGVHAALAGIASFATMPCVSRAFGSGDLALIETPVKPDDRYEMACCLANNQWALSEMASGQAWRELNP